MPNAGWAHGDNEANGNRGFRDDVQLIGERRPEQSTEDRSCRHAGYERQFDRHRTNPCHPKALKCGQLGMVSGLR